jgi:hypothetical protein
MSEKREKGDRPSRIGLPCQNTIVSDSVGIGYGTAKAISSVERDFVYGSKIDGAGGVPVRPPAVSRIEVTPSEQEALRWDQRAQVLCGHALLNGRPTYVSIPRAMIHRELHVYNDAVEWEIERFKEDIVSRLAPLLLREAAE